ncbi:type VII secretion system-associated protein [Micromonospora cathayae]|uniref:Type VII secretion system-associated protein n=1 Tax=Micromonospora cathayae TaxID=3028804 RepID=A0ABY7ZLI2_9ACTN|nr:type VII secretion system-associated protein [Micromonospora sp. HUAS 3]WDZ83747.1 type VII secretion system-associated protein [Micromonospora sp. HUAS 3]
MNTNHDPEAEPDDRKRTMVDQVDSYFLLMDPDWQPAPDDETPDPAALLGLWPVEADGSLGAFRANPDYRPRDADAVADPLDALFRMAVRGQAQAEQIQLVLRDTLFDVALNGDERPLIMRSPDGVPCVVIATSAPQRERVSAPQWRRIDLAELVSLLPDRVDTLFNPAGPVPMRLIGDVVRETLLMSDEEIAEARAVVLAALPPDRGVPVLPWVAGAPTGSAA